MTRARTKKIPNQYTWIPFHSKALKLLLKDLSQSMEGKATYPRVDSGIGFLQKSVTDELTDNVSFPNQYPL